jgi:hypothetical protein
MREASTTKTNERYLPHMCKIKEFYEEEIYANHVKNLNLKPSSAPVGATDNPDFTSYFKWMDEEIESLSKAVGRG